MQYKTIVLHLLEQNPEVRDQLRKQRQMLPTLDLYAQQLKTRHEEWKERLFQAKPGSDDSQIASEALELALEELKERLPSASRQSAAEPLSIDAAMTFIRRHTPPR